MSLEASDKLKHYADIHGDWVLETTPATARSIARGRKGLFDQLGGGAKYMYLLCESVQMECIAACHELMLLEAQA